MFRGTATWLAGRGTLPTAARAVFGFYGETGVFDLQSLQLKRQVDDVTEAMIETAFDPVEAAIATEFDREDVEFSYDTKLILPAQLTLGHLYRETDDPDRREEAEALTRLAIEALLDGDMRDAINDDEYEDFAVDFAVDDADRARIAELAQATLQERVESQFTEFCPAVREAYDWAVRVSEAHQTDDEHFRELYSAALDGDDEAAAAIRTEYREAPFEGEADPDGLTAEDQALPYARTQYDRVGVIYDGMLQMYRSAGFDIDEAFARSIVLAIVGAQIWLDDVDDFAADRREGQLTPVTAEYVLADSDAAAADRVLTMSEQYLDRAKAAATAANSPLSGIATEYIYRSGRPEVLPGHTDR